jgi:AbrB family looped-hinge helix DNA binding protein
MDTGMARKIDDLGRIVIPAETRRLFNIREGDHLSISVEGDRIVLRKMETTVAVGGHSFEVDRDTYFSWEQRIAEDIGSRDPDRVNDEIRRRLGI